MADDIPPQDGHSNDSDNLEKDAPSTTQDEHRKDDDMPKESASNRQSFSGFDFGDIVTGKVSLSSFSSSEKVKLAEVANETTTTQNLPYKSVFVGKNKKRKKSYTSNRHGRKNTNGYYTVINCKVAYVKSAFFFHRLA